MIEVAFALRRQRRTLTVWMVATTFYAALITLAFPSVHHAARSIQDTLPTDLAQAFGMGDLSTPAGYLGTELFGLILPLLLIAATITGTAALTAGYEDAGYFETLLVLPVGRGPILLARALAVLVGLTGTGVVLYAGLSGAGAAVNMHLSEGRLAAAVVTVAGLAALHAGIVYLAAGLGARRALALGVAAGIAVTGYAINNLLPLVHPLRGVAIYSPWHWTVGQDPLRTGLPAGGLLLTVAFIATFVIAGTIAFTRRDIHLA
ncbi:MAG: ABC transporter permease [Actinomycetota bacterium]|nr:ABC transporter permease [Actinomycetota bacterium]